MKGLFYVNGKEYNFDYMLDDDVLTLTNLRSGSELHGIVKVTKTESGYHYYSDISGLEYINMNNSPFRDSLTGFVNELTSLS